MKSIGLRLKLNILLLACFPWNILQSETFRNALKQLYNQTLIHCVMLWCHKLYDICSAGKNKQKKHVSPNTDKYRVGEGNVSFHENFLAS